MEVLLVGLGFVLLVLLALLVLKRPNLIPVLLIFTMGIDYLGRLGLGPLTVNNLSKFFYVILFGIAWLQSSRKVRVPYNLIHLMPFLVFAGLSVFWSARYGEGVVLWARLLFTWLFAIVMANVLREEKHFSLLGHAIAASTMMIAGLALIQGFGIFTEGPLAIHGAEMAVDRGVRVSGTFWNPNKMAVYLVGMIIFLFALLPGRRRSVQAFYILAMLAALSAIILSLSRSGWLALLLAVLVFTLIREYRRAALASLGVAGLTMVGVLCFTPYGQDLAERALSFASMQSDASASARMHLAASGFYIFADGLNFIWGGGWRSFSTEMVSHVHPLMSHDIYYHAGIRASHNYWVTVIAELGLIGLACLLLFLRGVFRDFSLTLRRLRSGAARQMLVGALVYVLVKLFDFNLNPEFMENLFWFAIGILGATCLLTDEVEPIVD